MEPSVTFWKSILFQKLLWPFTVQINCTNDPDRIAFAEGQEFANTFFSQGRSQHFSKQSTISNFLFPFTFFSQGSWLSHLFPTDDFFFLKSVNETESFRLEQWILNEANSVSCNSYSVKKYVPHTLQYIGVKSFSKKHSSFVDSHVVSN